MTASDARPSIMTAYRNDIDGLRAIAVLAVLLSHLRIPYMDGGYVGVDIFFVISGFVVFGDLLRRQANGTFSVTEFYVRRARRLAPQLIAMLIFVLLISSLVFLPSDYRRLPARIAATLLGVSNWLFAYQADYFMPASEWNPLLHTWTLSVEFQFYLCAPFLIGIAANRGRKVFAWALLTIGALSLAYAIAPRPAGDSWHFYDTFGRLWEFLLGGALHLGARSVRRTMAANALCLVALAVLAVCFVLLSRDSAFPDWRALPPTLATAALIAALAGTPLQRVLASSPITAIGRSSYSIYIWHWPVIVFATYLLPGLAEKHWLMASLTLPIVLLSVIAYKWVELPWRDQHRLSNGQFWKAIFAGGICLVLPTGAAAASLGWPERFTPRVVELDGAEGDINPRRSTCHRNVPDQPPLIRSCVYGAAVVPTVAVWSDSHGVELIAQLNRFLATRKLAAVQYSYSSCPPSKPEQILSDCSQNNAAVLELLLASPKIKTVVLAGAVDDPAYYGNWLWARNFTAAARLLQRAGKKLIIVYPVPRQPFPIPRAMANRERFSIPFQNITTSRAEYIRRTRYIFRVYDRLGQSNIHRAYPDDVFCRDGLCQTSDGRKPFYFDENHLSMTGAAQLAPAVALAMDN